MRRKRDKSDWGNYAIFMQDVTTIPPPRNLGAPVSCTIAVEIKPKRGTRASSYLVRPEHCSKFSVPYFSISQHFKVQESLDGRPSNWGHISHRSYYNPEDLFSGSCERISKAVKALFRNPQNLMKIFCDGLQCYGTGEESDLYRLDECLKSFYLDDIPDQSEIARLELLQLTSIVLSKESVLQSILSGQVLDCLEIEGASIIYEKLKSRMISRRALQVILDLARLATEHHHSKMPIFSGTPLEFEDYDRRHRRSLSMVESMSMTDCIEALKNWNLARVMRDCSIIIAFRRLPHVFDTSNLEHRNAITWKDSIVLYEISVIDIGLKSFDDIPKKCEYDHEMMKSWTRQWISER